MLVLDLSDVGLADPAKVSMAVSTFDVVTTRYFFNWC